MVRRILSLVVFSLVLAPSAPRAEEAKPGAPVEIVDVALRRSLDQPMFTELTTQWKRCLHDYQSRKYADLLVDLGNLKGLKASTGIRNLTPITRVLLRMALEMAEDPENADMAPKLAAHARVLGPDIPSAYVVSAQLSSRSGGEFSLGNTLKAFSGSVIASSRHLPALLDGVSKIAFIWFLLSLLASALFSLSVLVRYSKLLAHDVGHLFPPGATGPQKLILILLLLFIPFLLDLGVVILFMVWWIFLWLYMNRNERAGAILLLVLMASWPFAGKLLSAGVTPPDTVEVTLARCNHEVCSRDDVQHLEELRATEKGSLDVDYTLAINAYRTGAFDDQYLDDALVYLSGNLQSKNAFRRTRAFVLQGNIYFSKGVARCAADQGNLAAGAQEFQEADNSYRQSLEGRESVEALYNRGRVLFYRDQSGDGDQLIAKARNLDTHRIVEIEEVSQFAGQQEFLCGENFNHNRELLIPVLPVKDLFTATIHKQPTQELLGFHHQLLGPLPLDQMPLIAAVLGVLLILLGLGLRRFQFASHCVKCGAVSDPKDRPELTQSGICEGCLFYRIRGSFVDPKEIWRREKGIELRQRFQRRLERGLSFILPGMGQMLRGKPMRGVIFFGFFFLPVLSIFVSDPLLGNLPGIERDVGMPSVQIIALSLVALVVYLLTLLDIYSRD
ncbi:MAG: hypothetical protein ABIK09_18545 [Pseudomonadota bacterium]